MQLGRPWIHTSGAAPSSLHQRVKYAVEGHVVTVKKKLCLSLNLQHSRILKPLKKLLRLPSSHSKFWMLLLFLRVPLCPKMSEASKMVARFMLNSYYQKGKGLGNNLLGIFAPVELPSADERFGLGYEPKKGDKERIIQERREKRLARLEGREPQHQLHPQTRRSWEVEEGHPKHATYPPFLLRSKKGFRFVRRTVRRSGYLIGWLKMILNFYSFHNRKEKEG